VKRRERRGGHCVREVINETSRRSRRAVGKRPEADLESALASESRGSKRKSEEGISRDVSLILVRKMVYLEKD